MGCSRFLIVANPTSGRGRGRRTAETVADRLRVPAKQVEIRFTAARGQAEALARDACRDASPPGCIVACGGDGTIQEIANALAPLRDSMGDLCPVLGIAPAGRCNDLARAMGIKPDPEFIAEVLSSGMPKKIDLGRVNDRYFCTVATLGIDAEVTSFVDTMRMPLRGTPAYVYGALRVLARYQPKTLRIEGDFGVIDRPLTLASSANTRSYGGNIAIAPMADPTDGYLDLCVIDPVSRLRSLCLLPKLLKGTHESLNIVHFQRTRRLRIDAPEAMEVWADGERIARTPVTIDIVPAAVRVIVPR